MKQTLYCILLILSFFASGCEGNSKEKIGYVSTQKLFSDFQGTKEMQNKFKRLHGRQKYILDSIAFEIKTLETGGKIDLDKLAQKKGTYNRMVEEFTRSNSEQDQQYTEGLWKQINQYIGEYGRESKYKFIYGANGTGSLMYADTTLDLTNDVLNYMNKKYGGK